MPAGEQTINPSMAAEALLVDSIASELAGGDLVVDATALAGDPPRATTLVAALREREPTSVIACTGLLAQLADFVSVVEALVAVSAEWGATVVLDVPNHAFADDAHRANASVWGEGALAELRGLLPDDHVVFHQIALRGAAVVPAQDSAELALSLAVNARESAPVGFVLAFGRRASRLQATVAVTPADLGAERAYERARTAELAVLRATVHGRSPGSTATPPNGAQPAGTAR